MYHLYHFIGIIILEPWDFLIRLTIRTTVQQLTSKLSTKSKIKMASRGVQITRQVIFIDSWMIYSNEKSKTNLSGNSGYPRSHFNLWRKLNECSQSRGIWIFKQSKIFENRHYIFCAPIEILEFWISETYWYPNLNIVLFNFQFDEIFENVEI